MADICDFASEVGNPDSSTHDQWVNAKGKEGRLQVAKDFGLSQQDLDIVKEALDKKSSKPIENACSGHIEGTWVK